MELRGFPVDSSASCVRSPFPVHFRCGVFRNEGSAWRVGPISPLDRNSGSVQKRGRTGMSKPTVWRWWDRFLAEGVDGLLRDATRPPGKKPIKEDKVKALIDLAMSPPPAHCSVMAVPRPRGAMPICRIVMRSRPPRASVSPL